MQIAVRSRHVLLCACFALIGAVGCDWYPAPVQTVIPPTVQSELGVSATGAFIDAKTNDPVTASLNVRILDTAGAAATGIQTADGKSKNTFTVTSGLLQFSVDPAASFPKDLVIVAQGAGYAASSERLTISGAGTYKFVTKMANLTSPPNGASAVQTSAGTASSTGALTAAVSIATPPESVSGNTVALALPASTVITTSNGTPLVGALSATAAYFNNTSSSALASFPGGMSGVTAQTGSTTSSGAFVTAGFTAINITDANGNVAAHFAPAITLAIDVPQTTTNPLTGATLQAGDTVPLWSYNENTGRWKSEGNVPLTADSAGNLTATAQITHLSYYAIAFLTAACDVPVTLTGNTNGYVVAVQLKAEGFLAETSTATSATFKGVPDVALTATALFNGQTVGTSATSSATACSTSGYGVAVTIPTVTPATLDVIVENSCSADANAVSPVPSAGIMLSFPNDAAALPLFDTADANGHAHFSGLSAGTVVKVTASTRDTQGNTPSTISDQITLTGDAATDTITLSATKACVVLSGSFGG